jgi:hypothetical protein
MQTNLRTTEAMLRISNPASLVEFQGRVLSECIAAVIGSSAVLAHAMTLLAGETLSREIRHRPASD